MSELVYIIYQHTYRTNSMEFIEVKWTILYVLLVTVGSRYNKQWFIINGYWLCLCCGYLKKNPADFIFSAHDMFLE